MESIRARRSFETPACSGAASVSGADFFSDRVCACTKKQAGVQPVKAAVSFTTNYCFKKAVFFSRRI
jgi:hypothetical protein